jgi:hypothetical protein
VVVLSGDIGAPARLELAREPSKERPVVLQVLDEVFREDEVVLTLDRLPLGIPGNDPTRSPTPSGVA